jgi:hypothetical protein
VDAGTDLDPQFQDALGDLEQRIARAGPSKVAKKPSPAVSFSTPRHLMSASHTIAWCFSTRFFQPRSPSEACFSVEPTMSVNRTVERIVSSSGAVRSTPRNERSRSRSGSS